MKMVGIGKTLSRALSSSSAKSIAHSNSSMACLSWNLFDSLWSASQLRAFKVQGSDVKPGNVIEKKGRIYQVVKTEHNHQGRGSATIQVELRDVDSGNKTNERFRPDETFERVFVQEKSFTCLYTTKEEVLLMDPKTFEQLAVPINLFDDTSVYLKDEMTGIRVEMYDGKPLSASVPKHVTCTVKEAQAPVKGVTATPRYKKVLLDNGLIVQVPTHIVTGDKVVINTADHSYLTRA